MGDTLTSLDGFYLDFITFKTGKIEEGLESIYIAFKNKEKSEEKYKILSYTNKDLCNMNYQKIRDDFIDKNQMKQLEEKAKNELQNEDDLEL